MISQPSTLQCELFCRIGVLIEVNCETDFVARGDIFKGLCSDLAMQIAAFGDVVAVSADEIDPAVLEKEREIEMGKEDILSKPEDKRCSLKPFSQLFA